MRGVHLLCSYPAATLRIPALCKLSPEASVQITGLPCDRHKISLDHELHHMRRYVPLLGPYSRLRGVDSCLSFSDGQGLGAGGPVFLSPKDPKRTLGG